VRVIRLRDTDRIGNARNCFGGSRLNDGPTRTRSAAAMRLQTYHGESRSRRPNLIGGGGHPLSIDLVSVTASDFACALIARCIH